MLITALTLPSLKSNLPSFITGSPSTLKSPLVFLMQEAFTDPPMLTDSCSEQLHL